MSKIVTYDKVSWHFPEGKRCPSLDAAKIHFDVAMHWLDSNGLLTGEGREALELGIDSDFALTSYMVTEKGNRLLGRCYEEWLRSVHYGETPTTDLLDSCIADCT